MIKKKKILSSKEHRNHNNRTSLGYIITIIGFAACPCHLPISLPIVIALTSGSILGILFNEFWYIVVILSILIFFFGLVGGNLLVKSGHSKNILNCEKCNLESNSSVAGIN